VRRCNKLNCELYAGLHSLSRRVRSDLKCTDCEGDGTGKKAKKTGGTIKGTEAVLYKQVLRELVPAKKMRKDGRGPTKGCRLVKGQSVE